MICNHLIREHGGKLCSRRIMGIIGFTACIVAIFAQVQHPLLESLMWCSAALLTSTAADIISRDMTTRRDCNQGGA